MAYEASLKAKWDTQNAFDYAIKQAEQKAAQKAAKEAADKKSYDVVENLIVDFGFTDEQAAKAAEVTVNFVQKVRADLAKKKKS